MSYIKRGDSIKLVHTVKDSSVHMILSDIPYGISINNWDILHSNTNSSLLGISPSQEKAGNVFKRRGKPLNGWNSQDRNMSNEYYNWCMQWAPEWYRVMISGGSCFIFAGRRFAHRCIVAMEDAGFIFKDMIAWEKDVAAHRAQRISVVLDKRGDDENADKWEGWKLGNLRPLFEPILWFMKPYSQGSTLTDNILNNQVGGYNEQRLRMNQYLNKGIELSSNIIRTETKEFDRGLHEAQKPIHLMKTLIELVTIEGQVVLDPFMGSGSTIVAAKQLKREYIGFEIDKEYYKVAKKRIDEST